MISDIKHWSACNENGKSYSCDRYYSRSIQRSVYIEKSKWKSALRAPWLNLKGGPSQYTNHTAKIHAYFITTHLFVFSNALITKRSNYQYECSQPFICAVSSSLILLWHIAHTSMLLKNGVLHITSFSFCWVSEINNFKYSVIRSITITYKKINKL